MNAWQLERASSITREIYYGVHERVLVHVWLKISRTKILIALVNDFQAAHHFLIEKQNERLTGRARMVKRKSMNSLPASA